MSRDLPARPNLEHLKNQAKKILRDGGAPRLSDAQLLVAREYGFASWAKLKLHVESLSTDPVEVLVSAVRSGDVPAASRAFAKHPALTKRINDPLPGLHFDGKLLQVPVEQGNREMIDLLLHHGADINGASDWWAGGFTILDRADAELVPFLLERGAVMTINAAAKFGMLDAVRELLDADPSLVHARGGDGQTPLHVAATVDIAALLLDRGADIASLDVDHESTPAQYLIREHQDVARFLVSRGSPTDILMVAALGDIERVRAYLDADPASVRTSVTDEYFPTRNPRAGGTIYRWTLGWAKTPHALAREFGHMDVLELLTSRTPDTLKLVVACDAADGTAVTSLLARHPGLVAALSEKERCAIVNAAETNQTDAVLTMLSAGWPVDVRNPSGATALHWAAIHGNASLVREILKHHPPIDVRDRANNGTPLGWAVYGRDNGWDPRTSDYPATIQALLDAGAVMPSD